MQGIIFIFRKERVYLLVLACMVFILTVNSCHDSDKERIDIIDRYISNLHKSKFFNGAIVISDQDQIVYSKGFGQANIEKNIPFTINTTADGGSITKTFTSAAIFSLIEEDKIQLNDHITQYLPELSYSNLQIHHLLGHSSGIIGDDFFFAKAPSDSIITNDFFLNVLVEYQPELTFEPGKYFEYSNVNYILLALIIERVAKQNYESFITNRFFEPLKMPHSFLRPPLFEQWEGERTIGYDFINNTDNDGEDFEGFYGCCNLFLSATDLQKWNQAFIDKVVLSDESFRIGLGAYQLNDSTETNLNLLDWYLSEDEKAYHFTGDWRGFYTMVYRNIEKKSSITFITNGTMPFWLRSQIVYHINNLLDGKTITNFEAPDIQPIQHIDLILGTYKLSDSIDCMIEKDVDKLYLQYAEEAMYQIFQVDSGVLYIPGLDAWIWFPKREKVKFQEFIFSNVNWSRRGFRRIN